MRIVRFLAQGKTKYGILEGGVIRSLRGTPFARLSFEGQTYDPKAVRLLAPCAPSKIVCIGLNYRTHAEETKQPVPKVPLIFIKPSTAVIGPDELIVLPNQSDRVDYEGELAVVIGKQAKGVSESEAKFHVLGYTCFNDVSNRHNQRDDGQWTRAKGYDTFAPIGPWIETGIQPDDLLIETYHNSKCCQSSRTSDLIFSVFQVISFISSVMTLLPGDVIATGTPSGIGRLVAGDSVEVRIEGIGVLRNAVVGC